VFTNSVGSATTTAATLTVSAALTAPAITTHPSNQNDVAGNTATFSAAASGNPVPTVQWQVSTDGGATFSNVPGATSTTLSFSAAIGQNGNLYRAVFTNSQGSATTTAATLTVSAALTVPVITTNPANQTVTAGNTATFTAAATGNPAPTVQWQVSTDGGATFTNVPGATSTTLSFSAAVGQNGNKYRAVFTNSQGSATTTAATLTVIAVQPTCNVTAKLRGPYYLNGTYTVEPSIDAQISQAVGGVHRELFYSALGSVNVQNAQTTSCANIGTSSATVTFTGTAFGGSGAYAQGDIVTTTLAYS
jgi:hypothetical protein